MQGVVFSCDRAMQLDATLRSFHLHCEDPERVRLFVIYRATNSRHAQQYTELADEYGENHAAVFLRQRKFRADLLEILLAGKGESRVGPLRKWTAVSVAKLGFSWGLMLARDPLPYVIFLVDDNIFVDRFRLLDICEALEGHGDALGFSLRLGKNITYFHPLNRPQNQPKFLALGNHMLKFDWTSAEGDFGYPLEVSSSVYRIDDVFPLVSRARFTNPNVLEARMAESLRPFMTRRPYLLCYERSVAFCNPANIVQREWPNRAGADPEQSVDSLADRFDQGHRVDVAGYSGFIPIGCHQEVKLRMHRG